MEAILSRSGPALVPFRSPDTEEEEETQPGPES